MKRICTLPVLVAELTGRLLKLSQAEWMIGYHFKTRYLARP